MKYILQNQETSRLQFRLFAESDKQAWLPFIQAKDVIAYIGLDPLKTDEENFAQWRDRTLARYENNLGGINMMVLKNTNTIVGACGLLVQEVDGVQELEIGYQLLPAFWHNGYALEGAKKCKEFAFDNNFADSIISIIDVKNIASQKVAINNGMTLDKTTMYKGYEVDIFRVWK